VRYSVTIRKGTLFIAALILAIVVLVSCSSSLHPVNVTKGGVAIKGYDTVAYFTEGKPVKGDERYSFQWKGAKWLFSSKENQELFMSDPEKFAPQYGGY
jgi:YHS domain-containing protein